MNAIVAVESRPREMDEQDDVLLVAEDSLLDQEQALFLSEKLGSGPRPAAL